MIDIRTAGFIPFSLVHFHHPAGMTGDAAVGKEIWGVGEDHIKTTIWKL